MASPLHTPCMPPAFPLLVCRVGLACGWPQPRLAPRFEVGSRSVSR
jgi:hypothetical protein